MSIAGLLGRKIGMTTYYREDGTVVPVTALEVGPCVVTQVKTETRDGYEAVQLGYETVKKVNKPEAGHMARSGGKFRHLEEFRVSDLGEFEVGQELKADVFEAGQKVKVVGTSKGRGFSGGMRRHNFRGGPITHGQSDRQRAPGAIGSTTHPGHVWRGTRMAGQYGNAQTSVRGLTVVLADTERNLILIKGAVPGPRNGIVRIEKQNGV
jgi:large subunit ribosomal protein L3